MTTAAQNAPKLANLRVRELKPLSSPSRLKKEIPVSSTAETTVRKGREDPLFRLNWYNHCLRRPNLYQRS